MSLQVLAFSPTHASKDCFDCTEAQFIVEKLLLIDKMLRAKHGLQLFNFIVKVGISPQNYLIKKLL